MIEVHLCPELQSELIEAAAERELPLQNFVAQTLEAIAASRRLPKVAYTAEGHSSGVRLTGNSGAARLDDESFPWPAAHDCYRLARSR